LVSVGGGGLVAGLAAWFDSRCHVDALEPVNAPTLHAARAAGEPVDVAVSGLAADSLGARRIGDIAWAVSQRHIAGVHLLSDDAIARAQQRMWSQWRLAVEPAAALPLAALWEGVVQPVPTEKVCVIVCGANVDPATLVG
jgi:threonine dehydratase